jgi:hypothetical protein
VQKLSHVPNPVDLQEDRISAPHGISASLGPTLYVTLVPRGSYLDTFVALGGGSASLDFPKPIGSVSAPLAVTRFAYFQLPVPEQLANALALLSPESLSWPPAGAAVNPEGQAHWPLASPVDFASPVSTLEQGIAATHMPYGAVLSIDYPIPGPPRPPGAKQKKSTYTYGIDADSTIWTGHYLAAEAFRYAMTHDPEALGQVKKAIGGLQKDFDVTTDAVIEDHVTKAVPSWENGVFARSTMVYQDPHGWTYSVDERLSSGECLYVHPTGGWTIMGASLKRTFPTYAAAVRALSRSPFRKRTLIVPDPNKPILYGSGCGTPAEADRDSPISRDQYSGIFMGLAFAYELVPDPDVQEQAKRLIERALDFVIGQNWDVPLPPDGAVTTSFVGDFDAQLDLLRVGASIDPTHVPPGSSKSYQELYAEFAPASALAWLADWFSTLDPLHQYYKYNLAHAFFAPLLFLEQDPTLRGNYLYAYNIVRAATAMHRNAYFGLADILVGAASATSRSLSNPGLSLGDEIKSDLAGWIARWNTVKEANGMPRNATSDGAASYLAQLWPNSVKLYKDGNGNKSWQVTYPLPLEDRIGAGMEFVWQIPPFQAGIDPPGTSRTAAPPGSNVNRYTCSATPPTEGQIVACSSEASQEGPGVDYLLPYWLGLYLHVPGI